MSSDSLQGTKVRILDAALRLLRAQVAHASMGQIAKEAGVSRQAVYLHFKDRADLYVSLVRHVDEERDLPGALKEIVDAPTAEAGLDVAVRMQAQMNPKIYPVAAAMDGLRRQDDAIERAWQDRLDDRLTGARAAIARLSAEGVLRPDLDKDSAADLIWVIQSLGVWEDLVIGRGWSAARYEQHISDTLRRLLLR